MMGGGKDLDEAFKWLCQRASGGDFLILRATGDDAYNPYVNGLGPLNSVATLIIPDRATAVDPAVADIIRHAEAIFIAGGNQARYVNFWKGTPVQDAINEAFARGVPVGGTSAGLAVEGEFIYGALGDKDDDNDLASTDVLPDPYFPRVTLAREKQVDVVLADFHLHGGPVGLDLLERLSQNALARAGALVTANAGETLARAARERGFDVLRKPVRPAALRALLAALARRARASSVALTPTATE